MCDYSLEHVESRQAKAGDVLVSGIFSNSITRGFMEPGNPNVAVCLLPGTELAFDRDVECDHALGFFPTKKMGENTARFCRINETDKNTHHDALVFPSGRVVLVTRLVAGQNVRVLQVPVEIKAEEKAESIQVYRHPEGYGFQVGAAPANHSIEPVQATPEQILEEVVR